MEKTRNYHLTEEQNRNLEIKYIEKQLDLFDRHKGQSYFNWKMP